MALSSSDQHNITGIQLPADAFIVIVRTEWNASIVNRLEEGCVKVLKENNVTYSVITVPGAFEIGFAINCYWENHKNKGSRPHAFIALGCVLKGDTPHFEYVCNAVTESIAQLNLHLPVPSIFGVLTINKESEGEERVGGKHGHKGEESAVSAMKMIALAQSFKY